ncbi:DegV family protein [Fonticella tunisiensis]|uniref:DegV family protein with EDD domain n=1 Tax=Fonticella tunisiensis TaxID=1096341 RepID=A0A4R7K8D7_9CLOT|nr:DegV family protein [Fonticella tunisiensis]TDT47636.1 DegV family protein with EDD domain [Fonticella tunisiensis]
MKKIKIYTDSSCDLDVDVLNDLGVKMIPLTVHFGDELYKDRVTIGTREFYEKLKNNKELPKTSQINPAVFKEEFQKGLDEGYHIIYIAFSSRLSGTYQSGRVARDMLDKESIDVIDSKAASVGLGLIVREAAVMVKEGKTREEIIERVEYLKDRMEHIFAVGSLDMLKKGGRISTAQAVIGTLLNVKPILQFDDGAIIPYDRVRGEKGIIKKMIETMKERGYEIDKQVIGLSYAGDSALCMELKKEIEKVFGVKEFLISEIGPVIGSHAGPGTLALFFLRR